MQGDYRAGDLVCFRREQRRKDRDPARTSAANQESSHVWSTPARIIGFDNKVVWVICEGVPVTTAIDKLRPCTAAEVLAYTVLGQKGSVYQPPASGQQGFIDQRNAPDEEDEEEDYELVEAESEVAAEFCA